MSAQGQKDSKYHYERKLVMAACLLMIASSLLFIFREIYAQINSSTVSAIVLPNEFNTRPARQKNFFESLSTYQKIMIGSSAMLALSTGVVTYLLMASRQKTRS